MINKWTLALAAAGVVSLPSLRAEEQHQVLTALSQTTLSGYVDTSASWKIGSPNGALPGRTFDGADKQDGFNLNAVKLSLEKPLDEGQWSAGYKVDLIFGPDANYYGTMLNGGGGPNYDDFSVKQAYVALRAPVGNGLDIKMGVFDTLIGYEVFESVNNPNFSRSYGYAIEPTHHTGLLLSYKVADWLTIAGGVANGWTGPVNDKIQSTAGVGNDSWEERKAFLGMLTITVPESAGAVAGSAIYLGVVHGENTGTLGGGLTPETTSYYAGLTLNTPLKALSFGTAFDYRQDAIGATLPTVGDAWAVAGYASFQATEKLKLNARADYFHGEDGTLFTTGGFDSNGKVVGNFGQANRLGALTATVDYSLWANVVTRGEVRWDHSFNSERPFGGTDLDRDAVTVAANLVYKF